MAIVAKTIKSVYQARITLIKSLDDAIHLGTRSDKIDSSLSQRIKTTNFLSLLAITITIPILLLFIITGEYQGQIIAGYAIVAYISPLYFNSISRYFLARSSLMLNIHIVLVSSNIVLGYDSGIWQYLIPTAFISLLIFLKHEFWTMLSFFSLSILCILAVKYFHGLALVEFPFLDFFAALTTVLVGNGVVCYFFILLTKEQDAIKDYQMELQHAHEDLQSTHDELKLKSDEKSHFFQNISHELRTPLTLIMNPLENQSKLIPDNLDIKMAAKNSKRLYRLVNQLLDFQKLEAGRKKLELTMIDMSKFIYFCSEYFSSACDAKSISLSVMRDQHELILDGDPLWVKGEVDALEKIVFNFLSNAIKYSPQGGSIELGVLSVDSRVRFYVKDNGPGINKQNQDKLFKVFSQVDGSTTREYEGTGLGLALVKSLTEKMNGQVGVESSEDNGSIFWVEFPLVCSVKPLVDVLIIEDDEVMRLGLLMFLRNRLGIDGNQIASVSGFSEALTFLDQHIVRCIISDYHLPDGNGLDILSQCVQKHPDTKKIMLSGHPDLEIMQRSLNDGLVDKFFYKPVEYEEILPVIESFIKNSPLNHPVVIDGDFELRTWLLDSNAGNPEEDSDTDVCVNDEEDGPLILVVDDLKDLRDLISRDLRKQGYRVVTASNGEVAYDLVQKDKPDLILTDWMMPKMSGPDLIKSIKSDSDLGSIPMVLLTAKSDDESKLIGTEIGADAFLGKPFNEKEMTSIVRNLLALKNKEKEIASLNIQLTENVLKRYLAPDLVDQIVSGKETIDHEPKGVNATILFSDLAGFTDLSENVRAKTISKILNEYLEVMNEVIFEYGGTIDKFIGDSIMIIWGAPKAMAAEEQVRSATKCAIAMQEAMDQLNVRWAAYKVPELKMRIGIHNGLIIVGTFGSKRRSDYTAIGPVVNLASRVEAVCEPGMVYVTAEVCDMLDEDIAEEVGVFNLKGIAGSRNLYRLVS